MRRLVLEKKRMLLGKIKSATLVAENLKTTKGCRTNAWKVTGTRISFFSSSDNLQAKSKKVFWGDRGQKGRVWWSIMVPRNSENVVNWILAYCKIRWSQNLSEWVRMVFGIPTGPLPPKSFKSIKNRLRCKFLLFVSGFLSMCFHRFPMESYGIC